MTEKELRKLKRVELLELLVEQATEMKELRQELDQAREELANREIMLQEAGSIAEAALRLNNVFSAAEEAAKQYVDSARAMWLRQEASQQQTQCQESQSPNPLTDEGNCS